MSASRHDLVDSLAVLTTSALVLSTLDRSYDSRGYLVVGLVPVVLLLGLAWWAARRPQGPWLYVIAAILAYAPLGALVALRDPGPFLVPPWSSTGEVLAGTFTAPSQLVSTLPPVHGEGVLMVVPYAVGFLAGGFAAWLALGTRRAIAPALAVLVGLAAVIPVSVQTPSLALSRGALLAVLTLVWVSWRAHREEHPTGRGTVGRAVAGLLVAGLVAGVVALVVPDLRRDERRLLRAQGMPVSGLSSISDPASPAQGSDAEPLLLVDGLPQGRVVRFAALDTYAPSGWTVSARSPGTRDQSGTFQRIGPTITPIGRGPKVQRVRIRVQKAYTSDWLPTAGELTSLRFDSTNGRTQLSEVRYNQFTRSALVPGGVTAGDDYVFSAVLAGRSFEAEDSPFPIGAEQRQPAGAFLDVYLRPYARADDPVVGLRRFMRHLRDEGYVKFRGTSSQTAAGLARYFLAARPIAGSPYQYSALVALAASRLGIPARVVVGASPDNRGRVFATDVRSWVEVRTADGVWRTIPARRYVGRAGVLTRTDRIEAGPPVKPSRPPDPPSRDKKERERSPESQSATADESSSDLVGPVLRGGLVGLGLLVVLAVAGVPVAKVVRRRRRRSRRADIRQSFVGGWQQVVDVARDRGTPVPEHLGRVAQARLLGHGLSLARTADVAVFAPVPPPEQEVDAFWDEVDELCRSLMAEVPWHRRLRAWFTPASLVTSWSRRRQPAPEPASVTAAAARR